MKVLQLCNKPPQPMVDGGCIAMNTIATGLLDCGIDLKILTVATEKHPFVEEKIDPEFKSKTKITAAQGFAQRGCSWCNTVLGDIDRKHFYRPSGKNSFCPRYAEGQAWLARTKKPRVDFLLPPEEGTYTRLQVSRSFWMSLFLIGASSLKRLCEASITTDFLSTLSQTGRTRGTHKVGATKKGPKPR